MTANSRILYLTETKFAECHAIVMTFGIADDRGDLVTYPELDFERGLKTVESKAYFSSNMFSFGELKTRDHLSLPKLQRYTIPVMKAGQRALQRHYQQWNGIDPLSAVVVLRTAFKCNLVDVHSMAHHYSRQDASEAAYLFKRLLEDAGHPLGGEHTCALCKAQAR